MQATWTQRSHQEEIQPEAVQKIGTKARDEVKEIMQPTHIPE